MSFFDYKVKVAEIRYDQEGSLSLSWGETASSWGWLRAGAKWWSFERRLAKPRAHVSFCVLQGQNPTVLHFGLPQRLRVAQGCFQASPKPAKAVSVIAVGASLWKSPH